MQGPPPYTASPAMLRKQQLLQQAHRAAQEHTGVATSNSGAGKLDASEWSDYFDSQQQIELPERKCTFNVYTAGQKADAPVVFCVHGGGYTGLSWSLFTTHLKNDYRVVAMDMRGHGLSVSEDFDLSKSTLTADIVAVWQAMLGEEKPPTVLVGHSVGGAMVVWAALTNGISSLEGLVVVDVVEGTAISSLPHMNNILAKRPKSFASPRKAVEWSLEHKMARCAAAAMVSLPSQLRQAEGGEWVWRTPLEQSEPFWEEWYLGLSEAFLAVKVPKILLLAGADRLDKVLTIGQMQGKFQMILMPSAGHAVHEDQAEEAAAAVAHFLKRFRIGEPPLVFPSHALGLPPVLPQAAGPLHTPGDA